MSAEELARAVQFGATSGDRFPLVGERYAFVTLGVQGLGSIFGSERCVAPPAAFGADATRDMSRLTLPRAHASPTSGDSSGPLTARPLHTRRVTMERAISARRLDADLIGILRASRIQKLVPLLLVLSNAALISGRNVDVSVVALALACVLVVSVFGMQLNVLTDREMDRATKPELAEQLDRNPQLLRWLFWLECAASALLLLAIARRSVFVGAVLSAYALGFTCYSYNVFVPARAAECRLKAYWWGQVLAVLGGYFMLWLAGFGATRLDLQHAPQYWLTALSVSCLDYGMFLVESAEDAPEERAHGLRTLPALLGRRGTITVAALLAAAGATGVVAGTRSMHRAALLALLSASTLESIAVAVAFSSRHAESRMRFGERLADLAFWSARVGVCAILLAARIIP